MVEGRDVFLGGGESELLPFGIGIETVEGNHPGLMRCPLIVVGSHSDAESIIRKYWHYRMWYHWDRETEQMSSATASGGIPEAVQGAFQSLESGDPDFARGVTSVSLFFPKWIRSAVIRQLADLPRPIWVDADPARVMADKSMPIRTRGGKEVFLPVLEVPLDIEVEDDASIIVFNNLSDPAWGVLAPKDEDPVVYSSHSVHKRESEREAWTRVRQWIRSSGRSVSHEIQYPEGENLFPDYRATMEDTEIDVEITSAPNREKWTIDSSFRSLEKKIQEVARQPEDSREEVEREIVKGIERKATLVEDRPCVLILTNWSSHPFVDSSLWTDLDVGVFQAIFLIGAEQKDVHCVHGKI